MTEMTQTSCELFQDDLSAVLDGEPDVIDRHIDHLSDCDDCRDLRHEAGAYVTAVAGAGADYREPSDMFERIMASVDGQESKPAAEETSVPAPAPVREAAPKSPRPVATKRRWVPAIVGGAAFAAAAAVATYIAVGNSDKTEDVEGLTATVAEVEETGGEGLGLSIKNPGQADFGLVMANASIGAGAIIRTDERTRAKLRLSDGSEITLNRGTEVELDAKAPRGLRLRTGELVADIAHLDAGPNAVLSTANAVVEVLGTRFLLAASGDFTSVRVSRGLVALSNAAGRDEVRPGEEGIARGVSAPEVLPSGQLAEAMSFAEITADTRPADGAMAGIGELRAFKPGEKRDRDWKLKVAKQKVTVRIAGNIARTEIEQVFQNDSKTTLEGVYKFPLPSDAKIDRLALDVDKGFEEGAFVDKQRAAKIWKGVIRKATNRKKRPRGNDIIWVPGPWRDPALLEWQRGGRFELRIFPIPKNGSRTIKLAYTQVLPPQGSARRYVYPLAYSKDGSTSVDDFEVDVRIDGADQVRKPRVLGYEAEPTFAGSTTSMAYSAKNFKPRGNFIVEYSPVQAKAELRAWTFRGDVAVGPGKNSDSKRGGLDPKVADEQTKIAADKRPTALLALQPQLPRWNEARERDFVFVVDSSHSMVGEPYSRMRRLLSAAVGEMDRRDRVSVIACDVECKTMGSASAAPSAKASANLDAWLGEIEPAGASNLSASIETAARLAAERRRQGADAWVVVLSDGASSMGFRSAAGLERAADAIASKHEVSISTLGIGSDADDAVLGAVARAGGGHFLPWKPGQATSAAALALLETTYGVSLENPTVTLPGQMSDIAPAALPTIRAGQEVLVAARFSGQVAGEVILRGTVGGKPYEQRYPIELKASEARGNAFVPRMWASLDIAKRELAAVAEDRPTIVAMSKAYGVLSRHTSLLVLESEAMFKAFGIDRSQPSVRWTGDEGDTESVATAGLLDVGGYGKGSKGRVRNKKDSNKPSSKSLDDDEFFASGEALGGADGTMAPVPAAKPPVAKEKAPRADLRTTTRRRRPGRYMRRVYYRTGSVAKFKSVSSRLIKAVADAEATHAKEPNSREAHRTLVKTLSRAGQIERATEVAQKWLERDRFDTEALVYVSDMLARSGDRSKGLRLLSGIVDVAPDNASFHERLASAYDHADKKSAACAHRIAAAEIRGDATRLGGAVRCQRSLGLASDATWMLSRVSEKIREAAEKKANNTSAVKARRGQLQVEASWLGSSDLDISIITSRGERISWMGGRSGISGDNAMTPGREKVALRRLRTGSYTIEVSRSDAGDTTPIDGSLEIRLLGKKRTLTFKLESGTRRATVGSMRVRRQSRMVPM